LTRFGENRTSLAKRQKHPLTPAANSLNFSTHVTRKRVAARRLAPAFPPRKRASKFFRNRG